jgi:hypothetical protein
MSAAAAAASYTEKRLSYPFRQIRMSGIIGSDKVAAKYERLYEEVMRLSKSRLASINDERERQEELNILGVTGVDALDVIERQEAAAAAAAEASLEEERNDDPRANDIDYVTELEIAVDKNIMMVKNGTAQEEEFEDDEDEDKRRGI